MRGKFDALDASNLSVTLDATLDLVSDNGHRRAVPYVVVAGGYLRQRTLVGQGPGVPGLVPFVSSEGTASGGFGARFSVNSMLFVASEFRVGWEPETRIGVVVGLRVP